MARTAQFSPAEVEALIGTPRGGLRVDKDNRKYVKQWLTANGFPAQFVAGLSYIEMQLAYNEMDGSGLAKIRAKLNKAKEDGDNFESSGSGEIHVDGNTAKSNGHAVVAADDGSAGATLAKLVSPYLTDGIMNTVIDRVDAILANVSITRIELKRQDGTEHTIEGHVHPKFALLVKAATSRMKSGFHPNIMLHGPTGAGKTHAANALATLLGRDFETNGALTMDYQVLGHEDANGKYHDTAFFRAYGKPSVYLADEADANENSPCLAISGALANTHQTFPVGTLARHPDSIILAGCNTLALGPDGKFTGRNRLDAAFRSRFPIRIYWGYDEELEIAISGNPAWARRVQKARRKAETAGFDVVIDTRMIQAGAALIAQGIDESVVAEVTYLSDLDADQKRIVEGA